MTAIFDSRDFIEDAADILDKSQFQWLLVVAVAEQSLSVTSSINPAQLNKALATMPEAVVSNHIAGRIEKQKGNSNDEG